MFKITGHNHSVPPDLLSRCKQDLELALKDKSSGFPDVPNRQGLWDSCENLAAQWKGQVDQVVLVGTGGSSLGTQVIAEAFGLNHYIFVDNVDPLHFKSQMKSIKNPERTAWIITSKSGTTIETLMAVEMILLEVKLSQFVAVITEKKKNSLANWAEKNGYPHLEIPVDVGGRYSVLTPVGMFPAALGGLNVKAFQKGALAALKETDTIAQLMAQTILSYERREWITAFWIYASRGFFMGRWIQQLWAESLGKEKDITGKNPAARASTPISSVGTMDQHSVLQQMMEGEKDKLFWFFRFKSLESSQKLQKSNFPETQMMVGHSMGELLGAEAEATEKSLQQSGRATLCLQTEALSEESLGFFFMMMELVVAGIAQHLKINAFDQPGVELGKRLAREHFNKG